MAGQKKPTYYQLDGNTWGGMTADELKPTMIRYSSKPYDIVNQFAWTSIPKNSELRAEAPNAYVTGYELEQSQLQQFIEGYMHIAATIWAGKGPTDEEQAGRDFYKSLYKPTEMSKKSFNFPYFDNNIRQFTNNFADTLSKVTSRGANFGGMLFDWGKTIESEAAGTIAGLQQLGPFLENNAEVFGGGATKAAGELATKMGGGGDITQGTYIETPKFYQYENTDAPLNIEFVLANTIDEGDAERNLEFIREFTKINRPMRKGSVAMSFPYIYHIEVPCQRYIEWAFLESLNIQLLGTKRKIRNQSGGCTIVPEAYGCSFSFKSLTIEAANFMQDELLCSDNCYFDQYIGKQAEADLKADEREASERADMERAMKGYLDTAKSWVEKGTENINKAADDLMNKNKGLQHYDEGEAIGPPLDYDTIQRIQEKEGFDPDDGPPDDGPAIIYPPGEGPETKPDFRDPQPNTFEDDYKLLKPGILKPGKKVEEGRGRPPSGFGPGTPEFDNLLKEGVQKSREEREKKDTNTKDKIIIPRKPLDPAEEREKIRKYKENKEREQNNNQPKSRDDRWEKDNPNNIS